MVNLTKCIANISNKELILCSTGVTDNYKIIDEEQYIDLGECNSCPLYIKHKELTNSTDISSLGCQESCLKIIKTKEKTTYVNEFNRLKLSKTDMDRKLPKIPLKLFMYLHFSSELDSFGVISNLSIIRLAKEISCTTKSIRRSLQVLQDKNYIAYSTPGNDDVLNVMILSYRDNRRTKAEGGTGYIKVPNTVMERIIDSENINEIRIIIRLLMIEDKNNPMRGKKISEKDIEKDIDTISKRESFIDYRGLKRFLPKYMNSTPKIMKYVNRLTDLFSVRVKPFDVSFKTKQEADFVEVKSNAETDAILALSRYNDILDNKDLFNLTNLSLRYGIAAIINATEEVVETYSDRVKEKVENISGLIVEVIRRENILALNS